MTVTDRSQIIIEVNSMALEIDAIVLTRQLYTYLDAQVNAMDLSGSARSILVELNHADLSTYGLETLFIGQANGLSDLDEKDHILEVIDVNFRSYEFWKTYTQFNTYVNYIGGVNNEPQSISVWAALDRVAYNRLAISNTWGTNWDVRDRLLEAAARVSQVAKWLSGT